MKKYLPLILVHWPILISIAFGFIAFKGDWQTLYFQLIGFVYLCFLPFIFVAFSTDFRKEND